MLSNEIEPLMRQQYAARMQPVYNTVKACESAMKVIAAVDKSPLGYNCYGLSAPVTSNTRGNVRTRAQQGSSSFLTIEYNTWV